MHKVIGTTLAGDRVGSQRRGPARLPSQATNYSGHEHVRRFHSLSAQMLACYTHGLLHVLEKHVKTLLKASVALERLSEGCVARHACRYRAPFKRSQTLWPPSVPSQSGYFKFFAIRESIEASDFEKLNSEGAVSLMLRSLAVMPILAVASSNLVRAPP